jgi:hypothetical protein
MGHPHEHIARPGVAESEKDSFTMSGFIGDDSPRMTMHMDHIPEPGTAFTGEREGGYKV